jgi:hypothetical protein
MIWSILTCNATIGFNRLNPRRRMVFADARDRRQRGASRHDEHCIQSAPVADS